MTLTDAQAEPFRLALAKITGEATTRADPVTWAHRQLKEELYAKQRTIALSVRDNRRTAVHAAFGTGKSHIAAALAAWWIDTHPPGEAIVVTTATTFHQVRAVLWQEMGAMHAKAKLIGKMNQTDWWIGERLVGFGRRPPNWSPDAFTGIHRPYVLVIIDEASGVPKPIFDACEGLITNEESRLLAIGNPWAADSHFAHVCRLGTTWSVIKISAFDLPWSTGEVVPDVMSRALTSKMWVEENTAEWGTDSPMYQTKVLGEFPDEADDQLIPLSWIQQAIYHEIDKPYDRGTLGVDVARYGEDETVVAARWGGHIEIIDTWKKKPIDYTAGAIHRIAQQLPADVVQVDDDGVGGGVTDLCRANGLNVVALHNGGAALDPTKYVNARSQWWWEMREGFRVGDYDIPDDDLLAGQLSSIHWTLDARGRVKIESKDDMRARGVKSPDRADGVLYTCARSVASWDGIMPGGATKQSAAYAT